MLPPLPQLTGPAVVYQAVAAARSDRGGKAKERDSQSTAPTKGGRSRGAYHGSDHHPRPSPHSEQRYRILPPRRTSAKSCLDASSPSHKTSRGSLHSIGTDNPPTVGFIAANPKGRYSRPRKLILFKSALPCPMSSLSSDFRRTDL